MINSNKIIVSGKKGEYIASVLKSRVNVHKSKIPDSYLNISEICSAFSIPKTKLVNSLVSNHLYFVGPYILENNQAVRVLKSKANFTNDYYSEYIPANSNFARKWYVDGSNTTFIDRNYFEEKILKYLN